MIFRSLEANDSDESPAPPKSRALRLKVYPNRPETPLAQQLPGDKDQVMAELALLLGRVCVLGGRL